MAGKPSEKLTDTANEYISLDASIVLDNILDRQFDESEWQEGLDFVSRYCAMYVGFRNVGIEEESCVELVKTVIEKELYRESE